MEDMKNRWELKWKEDRIMTESQKVIIRGLWMSKALEDSKNHGDEPGHFAEHFDNFRADSLVQIIAPLYD